jgi:hypothetical protein
MSKYTPEMIQRCAEWVEVNGLYPQKCGAPVKQFCEAMGIDDDTYYEWKKKPEFSDRIKKAQEKFSQSTVTEVVNALKKKALGFEYVDKVQELSPKKVIIYDPKTGRKVAEEQGELITSKRTQKTVVVAPDTAAAIFLLTNLSPEEWKNYQRAEVVGSLNVHDARTLTAEEAAEVEAKLNELTKAQ